MALLEWLSRDEGALPPQSLADRYVMGPIGRQSLDEPALSSTSLDVVPAGRSVTGKPIDPRMAAYQQQVMRDAVRDALGFAGSTNLSIPRVAAPIRAYHGSPHNFPAERLVQMRDGSTQWITGKPDVLPDIPNGAKVIQDFPLGRFRMDKIGTGEGNQAYGYGAYAAEREGIGRGYRDTLSGRLNGHFVDGIPIEESSLSKGARNLVDLFRETKYDPQEYIQRSLSAADKWRARVAANPNDVVSAKNLELSESAISYWKELQGKKIEYRNDPGHMYEVNLHVDPKRLLDWDKTIGEQPELVQRLAGWNPGDVAARQAALSTNDTRLLEALQGNGNYSPVKMPPVPRGALPWSAEGSAFYENLVNQRGGLDWPITADAATRRAYQGRAKENATNYLLENGLQGVKYLDGSSRGSGAGTYNYVMFDPLRIEILRKYGLLPPLVGGGAAGLLSQPGLAEAAQQ